MKKYILILLTIFLLYGCSMPTRYEREPNDIGFGGDDYKKSKCACMQFNGETRKWQWI